MRHFTHPTTPRAKYDAAYAALRADLDACRISPQDARVKFDAMLSTYRAEKEAAELDGFLRDRGLGFVADKIEGRV